MIIIAVSLYLPEHITTIFTRAWFYYAGEDNATTAAVKGAGLQGGVASTGSRLPNQEVIDMLGAL